MGKQTLMDKYIAPPFTVLDSKQGYWIKRKKFWLDMGITSEKGREGIELLPKNFTKGYKGFENNNKTVSIFDPVVCELVYKWFNIPNGSVLDPFCGGSVRGVVASKVGNKYLGIDIREEQIIANIENAELIKNVNATWICDNSLNVDKYAKDKEYDLFFTCPPYSDMEVYSDLDGDISNKDYTTFLSMYEEIISKNLKKIKDDRFAVVMVGDIRDKQGYYRNFVADTKDIFIKNGYKLYNELIYLQRIGSAVLRADKQFKAYRKNVKIHENLLVFYKGDIKKIKENYKMLEDVFFVS